MQFVGQPLSSFYHFYHITILLYISIWWYYCPWWIRDHDWVHRGVMEEFYASAPPSYIQCAPSCVNLFILCNCTPMYVQCTRAIWHSQCRAEIRQQRNPCRAINFERRKKESSMKTHFERLNLGRKQAKEDEDAFWKIWTTARLLDIGSAVRLDGMSEWIKETQSQTAGF